MNLTASRVSPSLLLHELVALRDEVDAEGRAQLEQWRPRLVRRAFLPSALNLAHYLALRRRDLRRIQEALMPLGVSSLGRCESRVIPNLDAVIAALAALAGAEPRPLPSARSFFRGVRLLDRHSEAVFGRAPTGRQVRIMVTLPGEAARDAQLLEDLIRRGMDVARINCAHDDPETWTRLADAVRRAATATGRQCRVCMDLNGPRCRTGRVVAEDEEVRVRLGDLVLLVGGRPRSTPEVRAVVECSVPEVVEQLVPGDDVLINEGRIGAVVLERRSESALLEVRSADPKGARLRAEKGLNFPHTELRLPPLTDSDREALDVAAESADLVGYSFVQRPSDVEVLQSELRDRIADLDRVALVLKIETELGVRSLPELIVQAAGRQPLAVMIARGDLAVEIGYARLAEIQEELLWLCEAAHVPVIWATQVLDGFVRKGRASRAEVTDVAMAERAECVMLNKGPFVAEAVSMLDDVLGRMEEHQWKKTPRLRALRSW